MAKAKRPNFANVCIRVLNYRRQGTPVGNRDRGCKRIVSAGRHYYLALANEMTSYPNQVAMLELAGV